MAEDEDRASRIRDLKQEHPRLTWAEIARHVGVTERAATAWQRTGALKPENADALAGLFGVSFDYIWKGPKPDTPDPFGGNNSSAASEHQVDDVAVEFRGHVGSLEDRLARIEAKLTEARSEQDRISRLIEKQNRLLDRQSAILDKIEAAMDEESVAGRVDAAIAQVVRERGGSALEGEPQPRARARTKTARSGSPGASKPGPA